VARRRSEPPSHSPPQASGWRVPTHLLKRHQRPRAIWATVTTPTVSRSARSCDAAHDRRSESFVVVERRFAHVVRAPFIAPAHRTRGDESAERRPRRAGRLAPAGCLRCARGDRSAQQSWTRISGEASCSEGFLTKTSLYRRALIAVRVRPCPRGRVVVSRVAVAAATVAIVVVAATVRLNALYRLPTLARLLRPSERHTVSVTARRRCSPVLTPSGMLFVSSGSTRVRAASSQPATSTVGGLPYASRAVLS